MGTEEVMRHGRRMNSILFCLYRVVGCNNDRQHTFIGNSNKKLNTRNIYKYSPERGSQLEIFENCNKFDGNKRAFLF